MTPDRQLHNPRVDRVADHAALARWLNETIFSLADCAAARATIAAWPGYERTPLLRLGPLAAELGLAEIAYKDESGRFGLGSFKALGGAFAVHSLLADAVERRKGLRPTSAELARGDHADVARELTVASATAGNHGRSVAWGARMVGCRAMIYIHSGVGEARAAAIAGFGATVVRVDGDYDESVLAAASAAAANGWTVVSDTSYRGYVEIPRRVMTGYTVMMDELLDQLIGAPPTHILLQAGVGGLAAAAAAYLALRLGRERPRIIIVEPERADCLYQSARNACPTLASGGLGSFMLGLDCAQVSLVAWQVLDRLADDFVLVSEDEALLAMRRLNQLDGIVAGECAGSGLAVLEHARREPALARALGLDDRSRVLLIGTEGATDPDAYAALMAEPAPQPR
jgi:diaminopropionate ammonia-lyase